MAEMQRHLPGAVIGLERAADDVVTVQQFVERIGAEVVDRTSVALQFWVDSANEGKIGWEYFVALK